MGVGLESKRIYPASRTRLPLAIDFAGNVAPFELAMKLAHRVAESLPMRSDQVHLSAHQFASIHVSHGGPRDLDDLPLAFMRCDAGCRVVPSLVFATPGPAQPA